MDKNKACTSEDKNCLELIPKTIANATIKCACMGENAKNAITEELMRHVETIEHFPSYSSFSDSGIKEAAMGRAGQLRELAELIRSLPTCPRTE